ncbi:MAG: hypothetical protein HOV97_04380, partial [Nonomuraea sp.]|nr:hypothetical protein [Nonomuraea sp.]
IQDWATRRDALFALVGALAAQGRPDEAIRLAGEAEIHCGVSNPVAKAAALATLLETIARIESARTMTARLADTLVAMAEETGEARLGDWSVAAVVRAVAHADPGRAERLARTVKDAENHAEALIGIVQGLTVIGDRGRALEVAREADEHIGRLTDPKNRWGPRLQLVVAVTATGDVEAAEAVAAGIDDPGYQAQARSRIAVAVAATDRERARRLTTEVERLAVQVTFPDARTGALVALVAAMAASGDHEPAARRSREAENLIAHLDDDYAGDFLGDLAQAWSAGGQYDRAETLVRRIPDSDECMDALAELAHAAALAGDHERAKRLADDVETGWGQGRADYRRVAALAEALMVAGDPERARRMLSHAETLAHDIRDRERAHAVALLMTTANACQAFDRVRQLADEAETLPDPSLLNRARELTRLADAVAAAGDQTRALDLMAAAERSIYEDHNFDDTRAEAFADLAAVAITVGDTALAAELADDAALFVAQIGFPAQREEALEMLVSAAAAAGDLDRAEELTRRLTDPERYVQKLTELSATAGREGHRRAGLRLAHDAESRISRLSKLVPSGWESVPQLRAGALTALAGAVAANGDRTWTARLIDQAETYARQIDPTLQAQRMSPLAAMAATCGDHARAIRLAEEAESLNHLHPRWAEWFGLVKTHVVCGRIDLAEAMVTHVAGRQWQAHALTEIVEVIASTDPDNATVDRLADDAMVLLGENDMAVFIGMTAPRLVTALHVAGHEEHVAQVADRAEDLLGRTTDAADQMRALARLAKAVAATGDGRRCLRLADRAEALSTQDPLLVWLAEAMGDLIEGLTTIGRHDRALRLIEETVEAIDHSGHLEFQAVAMASLARAVTATGLAGDLAGRALGYIEQIPYPEERDRALASLVTTDTTLGRHELAEQHADLITDTGSRALALAHLAGTLGAAPLAERSEALVEQIDDPQARAQTLVAVIGKIASLEPARTQRLLAQADSLIAGDPYVQEHLITELAKTLAHLTTTASAPPELLTRARRQLAAALVTTSWWSVLSSLAYVEPAAVTAVADEMQAQWGIAEFGDQPPEPVVTPDPIPPAGVPAAPAWRRAWNQLRRPRWPR